MRFDAAQTLTVEAQAQARSNIGAASATAVGDTDTDFVAIFDAALADVSAGGDLKEVVTDHTKALVAAGTLARGDARSAATAAAACLKLAQG